MSKKTGSSAAGSAQRSGRWGRWFESSLPDNICIFLLSKLKIFFLSFFLK